MFEYYGGPENFDEDEEGDISETAPMTAASNGRKAPAVVASSAASPSAPGAGVGATSTGSPSVLLAHEDPVGVAIGDSGLWQLRLAFLLALLNVPCTWHIYAPTFQALPSEFWCARPDVLRNQLSIEAWRNISHKIKETDGVRSHDPCFVWEGMDHLESIDEFHNAAAAARAAKEGGVERQVVRCSKWEFIHLQYGKTVTEEWNLVCDRQYLNDVAEMMFLTGVAVGGLVSGMVSDKFGRKRTLMSSLVAQITVGTAIALNPYFELYLALRCLLGFISVGIVFSGFVLCMELVGGIWRTIAGVSYLFPVPLSYIGIAGVAYLVRDWRDLQLAITLPAILLLAFYWILPESPRWLLATGRLDQVLTVLQKAAKVNNRSIPPGIDKLLHQAVEQMHQERQTRPSAGILDLWTKKLRLVSFLLYIIWFSVYLVYYGLVLNVANLGGNVYINTIIYGAVEIPAIAISIIFLLKMGRRWPLCLTLIVAGAACLLTLLIAKEDSKSGAGYTAMIVLVMIGKFSVSSSNAVVPVFTAELFPTVVRNLGVGASNVPAGLALMLVPYLWNAAQIATQLPMILVGLAGVVGGLCVLLLPETAHKPLSDSVESGRETPHVPECLEGAETTPGSSGGVISPLESKEGAKSSEGNSDKSVGVANECRNERSHQRETILSSPTLKLKSHTTTMPNGALAT